MRSAGIRNKPVDRRYLSDQDKADYNNSGGYGRAATAVKRARHLAMLPYVTDLLK